MLSRLSMASKNVASVAARSQSSVLPRPSAHRLFSSARPATIARASTAPAFSASATSATRALALRGTARVRDWHQRKDPKTGEITYYNVFTKEVTTVVPERFLAHDAAQESGMTRFFRYDQIGNFGALGSSVNWRVMAIFFGVIGVIIAAEIYTTKSNEPTPEEEVVDREIARRIQEDRSRMLAENQAAHFYRQQQQQQRRPSSNY